MEILIQNQTESDENEVYHPMNKQSIYSSPVNFLLDNTLPQILWEKSSKFEYIK